MAIISESDKDASRLRCLSARFALWQSDGTSAGTHEVSDINLEVVSGFGELTAFGNKIAFSMYAPATGVELYVSDAMSEEAQTNAIADASVQKPGALTFSAMLYPNPAISKASINITGALKNVSVTVTDMSGKILCKATILINQ